MTCENTWSRLTAVLNFVFYAANHKRILNLNIWTPISSLDCLAWKSSNSRERRSSIREFRFHARRSWLFLLPNFTFLNVTNLNHLQVLPPGWYFCQKNPFVRRSRLVPAQRAGVTIRSLYILAGEYASLTWSFWSRSMKQEAGSLEHWSSRHNVEVFAHKYQSQKARNPIFHSHRPRNRGLDSTTGHYHSS